MAGTRRTTAAALLAALTLALGACTMPVLPGRDGPELAGDDVLTLTHPSAGMFGFFGTSYTEAGAATVRQTFLLPNGTEIFSVTEELATEDRERIEDAAEEFLDWERTLSDAQRHPCTDMPSTGIAISGSLTHESSVQDCRDETPLRLLERSVRDAQSALPGQLARPTGDWTVEIRPWAGHGPDETVPVERYRLSAAQHEIGMGITAQNPPPGWGRGLQPGAGEGSPLGWDTTGTVLVGINDVLLGQGQLGCGDPTGEIRLIREGTPSTTWSFRLCPGQRSDDLAELLREL